MSSDHFSRLKEVLLDLADLSETERIAYLDDTCQNQPALRAEIESILRHETDGSSLALSAAAHALHVRSPGEDVGTAAADELIGRTLAHYTVIDRIGEGGMGTVYRAADTKLGRHVALKVLPEEFAADATRLERFQQEARSVAALNHPNIVTLHSVEEVDGIHLLTMELVEGLSLDRLLPDSGFELQKFLDIAIPFADALWAAHEKDLVHRDLKPANLMLTHEGRVKVLDFGLARVVNESAPDVSVEARSVIDGGQAATEREAPDHPDDTRGSGGPPLTHVGAVLGTIPYMAPEQLRGETADARSDLFALGVVLYELVTGSHPFGGGGTSETVAAILRGEPQPPGERRPDVPPRLDRIITRCMATDAAHRYQSARDVRNDLEDAQREIEWGHRSASASSGDAGSVATRPGPSTGAAFTAYRESRIAEWTKPRYRLDREFVELTLLVDQGEETASGRWSAQTKRYRDLGELLDAIEDPALVVLGPPGCGKSTLLRRLELDVSQRALRGEDDRLTFFIPLNQYRGPTPGEPPPHPEVWLRGRWSARHPELPPLEEALRGGRMLLLLDALNEMPMESVADLRNTVLVWKTFLERLVTDHPGNRVVFSCRALDYSAPLSTSTLRVPQVVVEPLTDEQVEQFLLKQSPEKGKAIWRELRNTPQLALMRSPFFLALLVDHVDATGEVPKGRAGLFTGFVRQSLRREMERDNPLFAPDRLLTERDVRRVTQWRWKSDWELPERGVLVPKLVDLAFGMQDRSADGGASQVRIDLDEALDLLEDERDEDIVRAGVAISVLDEDTAQGEILFVHQLTQEYFAARHLAVTPEPGHVRTEWEAPKIIPPLVEVLESLGPGETLPALETTGWEETALLAGAMAADPDAFVRGLMGTRLELAGQCAVQPEVHARLSPDLLGELRSALVERSRAPGAELRARIAGGLALGPLGDPRFDRRTGPDGDYLLPPMVEIAGGYYSIGENEPFEYMGVIDRDHVPRHEVKIEPLMLGRFPVTNAEWAAFMQAGGYEDERWWATPASRRWWSGAGTADSARSNLRHWWERLTPAKLDELLESGQWTEDIYERWKTRLAMDEAELEEHLLEQYPGGKLRAPGAWDDDRFTNPAQPVVGVSWFEALAYTRWLSAQTGAEYRLPTEAEWEAATRGRDARSYAWGDGFDPLRCNSAPTRVGRPTPVGVFPDGDTPEGLSDLTGNVNEWTVSHFGTGAEAEVRYPYLAGDGREDLSAGSDVLRVLRGGSAHSDPVVLHSAVRHGNRPGSRSYEAGFRVASSGSSRVTSRA